MEAKIEVGNRRSAWTDYSQSSYAYDKNDYIQVTEWSNGGGVDVVLYSSIDLGKRRIELTYEELDLINQIINKLNNSTEE